MGTILEVATPKERGFLVRQFGSHQTEGQKAFDVAFGVVLPIVCLVVDPIVFRGGRGLLGPALLKDYQLFAYAVSGIEIAMLLVWWFLERQLTGFSAPFAGVFFAGATVSTAIGVLILPFSLIGLIVVIGIAGFTPFLTAFVFLRNGVRAVKSQLKNSTFGFRFITAALSGVLVIAIPSFASMQVSQVVSTSVASLIRGDRMEAEAAAGRLRWLPFVPDSDLDLLVNAYGNESDTERKEMLKQTYRDLTGQDIEHRLQSLND